MKVEKFICDRCAKDLGKDYRRKGERFLYIAPDGKQVGVDLCESCLNEFKYMLGFGKPEDADTLIGHIKESEIEVEYKWTSSKA